MRPAHVDFGRLSAKDDDGVAPIWWTVLDQATRVAA